MNSGSTKRLTAVYLLLLAWIPGYAADADYVPVVCDSTLAYAGKPLFPSRAVLPATDFELGTAFDEATAQRLDSALAEALMSTKARSITAAVANQNGQWSATRTVDDSTPPARFYWASAGKTLTASVVMQLVEEGKISLNDPISRWLPDFPNAAVISVDHLLHHTAGVFSANEDLVSRRKRHYRSMDENIAIAKKHGPMFCPGEHWRYSNTGYEMLGTIIEAVTGGSYQDAVKARIAQRLGLTSLVALAPAELPADVAVLVPSDKTEPVMVPSWGNAAGNVVASASDMLKFWHAVLSAKLLSPATTQGLFDTLYPMFDSGTYYGRGVMLYSFMDKGVSRIWLGHSGGAPGVKTIVLFDPDLQAFVTVALSGDGSAGASANLLLRQLAGQK